MGFQRLSLLGISSLLLLTACGTVSHQESAGLKVVTYKYHNLNYIPPSLKWESDKLCPGGYEIVKRINVPLDTEHAEEIWHIRCL